MKKSAYEILIDKFEEELIKECRRVLWLYSYKNPLGKKRYYFELLEDNKEYSKPVNKKLEDFGVDI